MADISNKSVFYGLDDDWGRTFFFTYYSQFQRDDVAIPAIEAAFLLMIFLGAFIGNALVVFVILRNKHLRISINFFIINLSISDILFTLGNPVIATTRITESWLMGEFMCRMVLYIEFACGFVSIWTMTFISIDRFKCIVLGRKNRMRGRTVAILIMTVWIVSFSLFIPIALYFQIKHFPFKNSTAKICTLVWPKVDTGLRVSFVFVALSVIFGFLVPITILIHNYIRIYRYLLKKREALHKAQDVSSPGGRRTRTMSIGDISRDQRDLKVVKVLILIVGTFLLSWTPIFVVMVILVYDNNTEKPQVSSQYFILAMCIAFVNACVNPVIYGTLNENFKRGFKTMCYSVSPRNCLRKMYKASESSDGLELRAHHGASYHQNDGIQNNCGPHSGLT